MDVSHLLCFLTCTAAYSETQPLVSSIKNHIEALHDGGTNHQPISRRRHSKAKAIERAILICD